MIYNIEQKLQDYLRKNYSPEVFDVGRMREVTENLLIQVARDWDIVHKQSHSERWYAETAKQAIDTFVDNWEGKQEGTDDRGRRFSKSYAFT